MAGPVLDERPHFEAIKARIAATNVALGADTYDFGEVPGEDGNPGTIPRIFVLLQVERRYMQNTRGVREATRSGWRVSIRYVGATSNEAKWAGKQVSTAMEAARLDVEGFESTPVEHESTEAVRPDDGMFSGLSAWTYAL